MREFPLVTFVIPVLNAAEQLPGCLESIVRQHYPEDMVEVLVVDGGSTDETVHVARSFRATVLDNPQKLAEPGVDIGIKSAKGEIIFVMAADNGLPCVDWIRLMVKPFVERPDVMGAFTQIVSSPTDNTFTRYYCRLHVEPFTWFVYGDTANPRFFGDAYDVTASGKGYVIYKFTVMKHPLIALAQGFGLRRTFVRRPGYEQDDILPIIQMIEDGQALAYVPDAGIYHHHLDSLGHFIRKYRWRIRNSLYETSAGFDTRGRYLSQWRRARKYLFEIYGLTMILPVIDSFTLALCEKDLCMLWHGPASITLSWIALIEHARKIWRGRTSRKSA